MGGDEALIPYFEPNYEANNTCEHVSLFSFTWLCIGPVISPNFVSWSKTTTKRKSSAAESEIGSLERERKMQRDVSSCNTYNYGDALYWDARYVQDALSFDWYQCYSSLRPFVRSFVSTSSRVLMVGCGNSRNSLSFCQ